MSIFTRLMAVIKNNAPAHSYSFTLAPIPGPPLPLAAATATPPTLGSPTEQAGQACVNPLTPTPLLTFHDRTPVWTARCSSGLIEMDEGQCRVLGVEPAFYVAVALTYLEFLEDREVRRGLSAFVLACVRWRGRVRVRRCEWECRADWTCDRATSSLRTTEADDGRGPRVDGGTGVSLRLCHCNLFCVWKVSYRVVLLLCYAILSRMHMHPHP